MSQPQTTHVKKKKNKKIYTYYKIENGKLIQNLKKCPRCGSFMAHHKKTKNRWACGFCSYTEYLAS